MPPSRRTRSGANSRPSGQGRGRGRRTATTRTVSTSLGTVTQSGLTTATSSATSASPDARDPVLQLIRDEFQSLQQLLASQLTNAHPASCGASTVTAATLVSVPSAMPTLVSSVSASGPSVVASLPSSIPSTGWSAHLGVMPPPSALTSVAALGTLSNPVLPVSVMVPTSSSALPVQLVPAPGLAPTPISNPSRLGMILSPSASPIPFRLVHCIQAGEFVEMRDLLADNVSLHNQLEDLQGVISVASTPSSLRPRLREIPSLSSWMYCFAAYMAVRTQDPQTRNMLAYCRLVIREALRHGGNGWQEYDRSFRRQAAIDGSLPWNTLIPGLQAATLTGSGSGRGVFCTICREPDHTATQCALAPMQQPVNPAPTGATMVTPRNIVRPPRRPETLDRICASWNQGTCSYPGTCTYKHECAVCHFDHKGIDCPSAPEGSVYRRLQLALRARRAPLASNSAT